ncbi:Alpha-L-arabinofuranosidase 1 [Hordeum vulgare]|nr:Alpha-L-arabinofuranosidase 1 [Hordeum vulgare]
MVESITLREEEQDTMCWKMSKDMLVSVSSAYQMFFIAKNVVAICMRGHGANDFPYDMLYEPYIAKLGLIPFVLQFKRTPPPVNHAALNALTNRWRPETHSFHLVCGEMTMTLEDVDMIRGLPINGSAVTGHVNAVNWRELVGFLIGVDPPPLCQARLIALK